MSNTYYTSKGIGVSKPTIDRKVREAKAQKLEDQKEEHDWNFCEECARLENPMMWVRLDCAHTISVDECQKTGRTELAWDVDNIRILCRRHHQEQDKLTINK